MDLNIQKRKEIWGIPERKYNFSNHCVENLKSLDFQPSVARGKMTYRPYSDLCPGNTWKMSLLSLIVCGASVEQMRAKLCWGPRGCTLVHTPYAHTVDRGDANLLVHTPFVHTTHDDKRPEQNAWWITGTRFLLLFKCQTNYCCFSELSMIWKLWSFCKTRFDIRILTSLGWFEFMKVTAALWEALQSHLFILQQYDISENHDHKKMIFQKIKNTKRWCFRK